MEKFRLKQLKVRDNKIFQEAQFDFSQETDVFSDSSPYFTLIIGSNGTGKSILLRMIIDIFRVAYQKQKKNEISYYPIGKYSLEYCLDDDYYTITNSRVLHSVHAESDGFSEEKDDKGIICLKGGEEIDFKSLKFPNSILALSIMLGDKYLFLDDPSTFPVYNYLGIRYGSNIARTQSHLNKTIEYVYDAIDKQPFIDCVSSLLSFLELDKTFLISYYPRYKHLFFKGTLKQEEFEDYFLNYKDHLHRETEPWSIAIYKKLKLKEPGIIPKLVSLLNFLSSRLEREYEGSRTKYFEFNIFDHEKFPLESLKLLRYLHKLDLISYPGIGLMRGGNYYMANESSSGEYHFITSVLGLLAKIQDNSIVLIDEPEISLHPNWQMKYMGFLNSIFKSYNTVHFIICSHSHFLISDLDGDNSNIIGLKRENGKIETVKFPENINTYGWSAEDVLYRVFGVRTTRNYFMEIELRELLHLISEKSKNSTQINGIINRLQKVKLNEEDPLNLIIRQAKNYIDTL